MAKSIRVNFIFNLAYKNPFFYELLDRLTAIGHEVLVYDFISAQKYNPRTKEIIKFNPFIGARFILKIKYVRRLFIPCINKRIIKQEFKRDAIVNIHYVHEAYVQYASLVKMNCLKLVTTFWGSDVLRANEIIRKKYIPLLESSDKITMVHGIQEEFINIYPQFKEKIRTTYFGLKSLELIKALDNFSLIFFKEKFDLPNDQVIYVTLGYNASPAQQHLTLIEIIEKLDENIKSKLFLLLPMSYGGSPEYKKEVQNVLQKSNISYKIFPNYLIDKDLCLLRKVSCLTLNIQKTDAFSGSISEAIMAGNIILVGDWLPYDIYESWQVKIFRASLVQFESKLIDILENLKKYQEDIHNNSKVIYDKLNWEKVIPVWEEVLT